MPRRSKGPVYYSSKKAWFANIKNEQVKLVEGPKKATEKDAWDRYAKVKQAREAEVAGDRSETWAILNAYLTNAKTRTAPPPLAPNTYRIHEIAIRDFCGFEFEPGKTCRSVPVRDLKMAHIDKWVAARKAGRVFDTNRGEVKWSDTYAHLQLRVLRTAFRWAANEGEYISESPFARKGKRVRLGTPDLTLKRLAITDEEHAAMLAQAGRRKKGNFADLLRFLYATGARPAEIYLARGDEWDADRQAIVIDPADPRSVGRLKTRRHLLRSGRKRVIRIPNHLVKVVENLRHDYGDGLLFHMEDGRPWQSAGKVADRMRGLVVTVNKVAAKMNKPQAVRPGISLYSYRHAYVTRFLRDGGSLMRLCEVLNTSTQMVQAHYSHLLDEHDVLLDVVNKYGGGPRESAPRPRRSSPSEGQATV